MDGQRIPSRALERYAVVSLVLTRVTAGKKLVAAVAEVAAMEHLSSKKGELVIHTERSIYRWLKRYKKRGVQGLVDKSRKKVKVTRVLSDKLIATLQAEKTKDARASIPEIIHRARQMDIITPEESVSRVTLWRACVRLNLPILPSSVPRNYSARPFEYSNRMQMVLVDGKHFTAGINNAKRVALIFLDDASRFGLSVVVGCSESTALFMRGFFKALTSHGFMSTLYFDRGPGFRSFDTIEVLAALNIRFVHGRKRYPPGRAKIERFNRILLAELLRGFVGNPEVDPDPMALELMLEHYLSRIYNHHKRDDETIPYERFMNDALPLRFPDCEEELKKKFILAGTRRVNEDNTVKMPPKSTLYEMPLGYMGLEVTVYHNVLTRKVLFAHEGKLIELHPADKNFNAIAGRARPPDSKGAAPSPVKTAAMMAFDKEFRPLVDSDGGFHNLED